MARQKVAARLRRKKSIRKKIRGTQEKPRLTVVRSNKHIYAQAIDDVNGVTIVSSSTLNKEAMVGLDGMKKREQAKKIGQIVGKKLIDKGVEKVVFDRNGVLYHGRIAALAEGAREAGLRF